MQIQNDLYGFFWLDPLSNNANSFLIDREVKILIDPGHDHLFAHVEAELERLSLATGDIDTVLITHGHPDHIEGARRFAGSRTNIAIHDIELGFIRKLAPYYGDTLGVADFAPQILLQEGDLHLGDITLTVLHTPGHSPGSVCLYWQERKVLFTGDVVFNEGIGRTDLPGGNLTQLKESIRRLADLDVEILLPGHGDMVEGREAVQRNFREIEDYWFAP